MKHTFAFFLTMVTLMSFAQQDALAEHGTYLIEKCGKSAPGFDSGKVKFKKDGSFKMRLIDQKKKLKCSGFWSVHDSGYLLTLDDANFLLDGLPEIGDQISLFDHRIGFGSVCIQLKD